MGLSGWVGIEACRWRDSRRWYIMAKAVSSDGGVGVMVQGSEFVHRGKAPSFTNLATTTCYNAFSPHNIGQPRGCNSQAQCDH
jgi:hypothetical protein